MVQGLRFCTSSAGGTDSISGQGTKTPREPPHTKKKVIREYANMPVSNVTVGIFSLCYQIKQSKWKSKKSKGYILKKDIY